MHQPCLRLSSLLFDAEASSFDRQCGENEGRGNTERAGRMKNAGRTGHARCRRRRYYTLPLAVVKRIIFEIAGMRLAISPRLELGVEGLVGGGSLPHREGGAGRSAPNEAPPRVPGAPPSAAMPATAAPAPPASTPALVPDDPAVSSGVPATSGSSAMPPTLLRYTVIVGGFVGVGVGLAGQSGNG